MGNLLPLVSIVIVNWNGKKSCLESLDSIEKLNYPKNRLEIIVVDNASEDGSVEAIKKFFPKVKLFVQKNNTGLGPALNFGFKKSKGKYILMLNNDQILDRDCLNELVKVMGEDKKIALVGAKTYFMDDPKRIQCMWGKLNKKTMQVDRIGAGQIDKGQYEQTVEADYVSFFSLVRKKALEEIGYFDERYFYGFEETDLMIRLRQAGYKLVFVPKAKIWHRGACSLGAKNPANIYFLTRNNLFIRNKFNRFTLFDHYKNVRFFCSACYFSIFGEKKKQPLYRAVVKGIIDYYLGKLGKPDFLK